MGITVSTLALTSFRGTEIPDHQTGHMVKVKVIGYQHNHPVYVLVYPDGGVRCLKWMDGQATAGTVLPLTVKGVEMLSKKIMKEEVAQA